MDPDEVCAECGREFVSARERAWCSEACARAAWARTHPNVPVRRPGRHRGGADQLRPEDQRRGPGGRGR